jgi:hypothetical protein
MSVPTIDPADTAIIDDAIAAVEDARARAPRDYLAALAIVLVLAAAASLTIAVLAGPGVLQDVLLNLGVELIGALVTVVVIDGIWKRREAAATASMSTMIDRLAARRKVRLAAEEREAWRTLAGDYRQLTGDESLLDRLRDLPGYRRRLDDLQRRATGILESFD